ncbi:MAG: oligosaccharide flippase family protein [Rhodospirillales bacterium]|nr:oligosaccharide flippase family protein [Rhodospirillales bacterium]
MIRLSKLQIGGALLSGGNLLQAVAAFAVNLVLVRYISPSDFGWFALVFAEASLVYAVLSIRTNVLVIRATEAQLDDDSRDMYFNAALQETVIATALIFVWLWLTNSAGRWETIIVLTLAVRHWTVLNKAYFERELPYTQLSVVETSAAFAGQLAALAVVLLGGGWIALVLRELAQTVMTLLALIRVRGVTLRRLRLLGPNDYQRLYYESRGVWLDGMLEATFGRLAIMAAGYIGGDALAGLVFQAQRLASVPHQVLAPFVNRIIMNWFSRVEEDDVRRRGRFRAVLVTIVLLSLAAIMTLLFADPVVPWLLGEDWAGTAPLMMGMVGLIVFLSPFEILRSYCVAIHRTRIVLVARIVQHLGFIIPVALAALGVIASSTGLSFGFSVAYAAAFIVVMLQLRHFERT